MEIECAPKLGALINAEKRVKILVGGRGSTKSTFVADYVLASMSQGGLWCCAREQLNSIEESVHRLLLSESRRLGFDGFTSDKNHIYHASGGRNFYRGLARNPVSLQSTLSGVTGLWIEEGQSLSGDTLKSLTASVRRDAETAQRVLAGEIVQMPEIWITMNRGSSKDPIAQHYLKRAEKALAKAGIYEDDAVMIVQINFDEIPPAWFEASGLVPEHDDDLRNMSQAAYDHKWKGQYNDTVENAIILPEWFDACVDAHKRLGFEPRGVEVVSHDPSDTGADSKGLAYRHGVVFLDVREREFGDVNEGCDWALDYAIAKKPDVFIWDGDGMGVALRRQVNDSLKDKRIEIDMFRGAVEPDLPDAIYESGNDRNQKTNKQTFKNKRAQYYWELRDRCHRTWRAVTQGAYIDPDELISFSSGIEGIDLLRAEICRIPNKSNGTGLIQIMTKAEMRALGIESPNMADSVMMCLAGHLPDADDAYESVVIPNAYTAFR